MGTLERAIAIATEAHVGQTDKAGQPYILHVLRVVIAVSSADQRIAAALHDVVEDNPAWSLERLHGEGFSEVILDAVDALTRRPDEDYSSFVRRAGRNLIARAVKAADLRDNSDLTRLMNVTDRDRARRGKYDRALAILGSSHPT